jgi:hypothetical protein
LRLGRFRLFHQHFLKDAESGAARGKTELVGQSRKATDVGVRHFNIFIFQHQNDLMKVIN